MNRKQYERAIIIMCIKHYLKLTGIVAGFIFALITFFWALHRLGLLEIIVKTPWWFCFAMFGFLFIALEIALLMHTDPWIKWTHFYPGLHNMGYRAKKPFQEKEDERENFS